MLSKRVKRALLDEENELYVSVASIWEIRLKIQAVTLKLLIEPEYLESTLRKLGVKVYRLARIHKDPFGRLLVAQSMVEGMTFVSKDAAIAAYGVPVLW